jgi:hypothetical protein
MGIWYATREQIKLSLEVAHGSRANAMIDRCIDAASRAIEGQLRRRFYPERKTVKFDWPNYQGAFPWQLWLDGNELISLETLTVGGSAISASDYLLRRSDDIDEPPYNLLEIDLSSSAAFSSGDTHQQAILALGLYGWNNTDSSITHATLGGNVNSSVTTFVLNPSSGIYGVGVGSIVLIGTERVVVTERRMSDTTQNLQSTMAELQSDQTVDVTDGTAFAIGETILIDSERMRISDIAGNNLIVERAWDGTTLGAHSASADVYAERTFTVQRGALGSTAASHTSGDLAYAHGYPALINELCVAEAVVMLEQNSAAYARVVGSGASAREAVGKGLDDVRARAYEVYGRCGRSAAI